MTNLPYVYRLTHKSNGCLYIGYRSNNKVPAHEDLGTIYFTSSKVVGPTFSEFDIEIIQEFLTAEEAYLYEQRLIYENIRNPLLLNMHCSHESKGYFRCPRGFKKTEVAIEKLRKPKTADARLNMKHTDEWSHNHSEQMKRKKWYHSTLTGIAKMLSDDEVTSEYSVGRGKNGNKRKRVTPAWNKGLVGRQVAWNRGLKLK